MKNVEMNVKYVIIAVTGNVQIAAITGTAVVVYNAKHSVQQQLYVEDKSSTLPNGNVR